MSIEIRPWKPITLWPLFFQWFLKFSIRNQAVRWFLFIKKLVKIKKLLWWSAFFVYNLFYSDLLFSKTLFSDSMVDVELCFIQEKVLLIKRLSKSFTKEYVSYTARTYESEIKILRFLRFVFNFYRFVWLVIHGFITRCFKFSKKLYDYFYKPNYYTSLCEWIFWKGILRNTNKIVLYRGIWIEQRFNYTIKE